LETSKSIPGRLKSKPLNKFLIEIRSVFFLFMLSSCAAYHTVESGAVPHQHDYLKFNTRLVKNQSPVFHFYISDKQDLGHNLYLENKAFDPTSISLDSFVVTHKTISFLIIRNDTILYQKYLEGYTDSSIVSSFSIAKAFVGSLVGIALGERLIGSETDPLTNYLPELKNNPGFEKITIEHLLHHTSGIKFSDSELDLGSDNARFYWGNNLRKEVMGLKMECPPGRYFHYSSANTQILGMILERVYKKPLSQILQEKIWKPLGMESPATWAIDRNDSLGIEKAFCCIYARAIDFAKFGKLYLNHGRWNGIQIVPEDWVKKSINPEIDGNNRRYYNNNFGLSPLKYHNFFAVGLYGQYIYCDPEKNIIIVRFGNSELSLNSAYWNLIMMQIVDQL
jgi:CubicO group peptidase (beta-lactamase class C family)